MIINAFLQARFSSTRLPGKVLKVLAGKTMLEHQIERLKRSKTINTIVVLTSLDKSDDAIERICKKNHIHCFRGELNDVLSRFTAALAVYPCDNVVRITGDCPLLDWNVVDSIINEHLEKNVDYTSNTIIPTYPDGLDVEVIKSDCLLDVNTHPLKSYEREHVTYSIYQNPDLYTLHNVLNPLGDESHLRWTVDELVDYEFMCTVYNELYTGKPFSTHAIRMLLSEKPDISNINKGFYRNEGLSKTLQGLTK
jgi:spore coat polysaccharide biosynthesis protein SpsF